MWCKVPKAWLHPYRCCVPTAAETCLGWVATGSTAVRPWEEQPVWRGEAHLRGPLCRLAGGNAGAPAAALRARLGWRGAENTASRSLPRPASEFGWFSSFSGRVYFGISFSLF